MSSACGPSWRKVQCSEDLQHAIASKTMNCINVMYEFGKHPCITISQQLTSAIQLKICFQTGALHHKFPLHRNELQLQGMDCALVLASCCVSEIL